MKYHVNAKGEPGRCSAHNGNCPFGGEDRHHESPQEARQAYEARMVESLVPAGVEKKDLGLKALNDLVKYDSDQDALLEAVNRGSDRTLKNLAKNPHAGPRVLLAAARKTEDQAVRDALYDHERFDPAAMPVEALAARINRHPDTRAMKLAESDALDDAHIAELKKINPEMKNVNVTGMLRNRYNGLSQGTVVELAEKSWITMGAAMHSDRYPAERIKDLPKALVYWGDVDRTSNPAYLEGYADWAIGQKDVDKHNAQYYSARVATNPETPVSALAKLAEADLALVEVYNHPRSTDSIRSLCASKSDEVGRVAKIAALEERFGGRLKDEIVYVENHNNPFGANRGIRDTRVRFNLERLEELGMDEQDVITFMGRNKFNGGASYDRRTGIFSGTVDSTD